MAFNDFNSVGSYIRSTNIWDPGQVYDVPGLSPELRDLLVKLYTNLTELTEVLSTKESAYYPLQEFLTSAQFFNLATQDPNQQRMEFRRTYSTGAVLAMTTATIPHGLTINAGFNTVVLEGSLTDNVGHKYYPINYGTTVTSYMDGTNIYVNNGTAINFTSGIVIVRFLKN